MMAYEYVKQASLLNWILLRKPHRCHAGNERDSELDFYTNTASAASHRCNSDVAVGKRLAWAAMGRASNKATLALNTTFSWMQSAYQRAKTSGPDLNVKAAYCAPFR